MEWFVLIEAPWGRVFRRPGGTTALPTTMRRRGFTTRRYAERVAEQARRMHRDATVSVVDRQPT